MTLDNYIYLTLSNDNILIEQDILMYDLNSIIGSIGGSLGLFVGFSFLQCSRDFVKFVFPLPRFHFLKNNVVFQKC